MLYVGAAAPRVISYSRTLWCRARSEAARTSIKLHYAHRCSEHSLLWSVKKGGQNYRIFVILFGRQTSWETKGRKKPCLSNFSKHKARPLFSTKKAVLLWLMRRVDLFKQMTWSCWAAWTLLIQEKKKYTLQMVWSDGSVAWKNQVGKGGIQMVVPPCPCIKTSENKQTFWCRVSYSHCPVLRKTLKRISCFNLRWQCPIFPERLQGVWHQTWHDWGWVWGGLFCGCRLISFCERGTDPAWWGLNDLTNILPPVLVIDLGWWLELRLFVRESGVFVPARTWDLCANVARWTSNHIKFDPCRFAQGVPHIALR